MTARRHAGPTRCHWLPPTSATKLVQAHTGARACGRHDPPPGASFRAPQPHRDCARRHRRCLVSVATQQKSHCSPSTLIIVCCVCSMQWNHRYAQHLPRRLQQIRIPCIIGGTTSKVTPDGSKASYRSFDTVTGAARIPTQVLPHTASQQSCPPRPASGRRPVTCHLLGRALEGRILERHNLTL